MKNQDHTYSLLTTWSGNQGVGTKDYQSYSRDHTVQVNKKPILYFSSDPMFRGDASKYNPEELFLASLSSCHMLWYLHLCAVNQIVVEAYEDHAEGTLSIDADGGGRFTGVQLNPSVTLQSGSNEELAKSLHEQANTKCFIANSCNFEVTHHCEISYRTVEKPSL